MPPLLQSKRVDYQNSMAYTINFFFIALSEKEGNTALITDIGV